MTRTKGTVLIVDDEPDVTNAYSSYLSNSFNCIVAHNGKEALQKYDSDVDVVLLDRRMPDMSGDEILAEIRQREGDPQVAMVTAIDPDFDIINLGFNDYIVKPVTITQINNLVEAMMTRAEYKEEVNKYYVMVLKKVTLEENISNAELGSNESYQSLLEDIEEIEKELEDILEEISEEDVELAFRDLQ